MDGEHAMGLFRSFDARLRMVERALKDIANAHNAVLGGFDGVARDVFDCKTELRNMIDFLGDDYAKARTGSDVVETKIAGQIPTTPKGGEAS